MATSGHIGVEWAQLERLAVALRIAASIAVARGSWFAPTLDDCRVDVERLLSVGSAAVAGGEAHALIVRGELALRTWRRIVSVLGFAPKGARCGACGGRLSDVACPGRVVPFRGLRVEVPADFAIPTCEDCGAESLDGKTADAFDAALLAALSLRS